MQEKAKRKPLKMLSSNTISMEPKTAVKPKQHNGFSMEIPCLSPWNCITKIWMVWVVAIKCEQTFHLPECKGNGGHSRCGFSWIYESQSHWFWCASLRTTSSKPRLEKKAFLSLGLSLEADCAVALGGKTGKKTKIEHSRRKGSRTSKKKDCILGWSTKRTW